MATEHRDIIDSERHENKGASTALAGQVMVGTGTGQTSFVNPSSLSLVSVGSSIEGVSTTTQNPTAVDTPIQVVWGAGSSNTDVNIASNGIVTILTSGLYFITFNLNLGRATNVGTAILLARLLVNDVPTGFVQASKIDTSININPLNASIFKAFSANDTIKVQLIRDSSGANDGGLITVDPVLVGWNNSPSAAIRVQKITGGF